MPGLIKTKRCTSCNQTKPLSEYYPVSRNNPSQGLRARCAACLNTDNYNRRERNYVPPPYTGDLPSEKWKPVVGFESSYSVSTLGRVRREGRGMGSRPGRILKPFIDEEGYVHVGLSDNHVFVCRSVHTLVAAAFLGPCPEGKEVNHIDTNKSNNQDLNLEYLTHPENIQHSIINGCQDNSTAGINRLKSHCIRGHALSGDNLYSYISRTGGKCRMCRACIKTRKENRRQAIP